MPVIDRRRFLLTTGAALAMAGAGRVGIARALTANLPLGPAVPFSFDRLIAEARQAATQPYVAPVVPSPAILDKIDYDAYWAIKFKESAAPILGKDEAIEFFHLGKYARTPVTISLIENGTARKILYSPSLFEMPADSPARKLGPDAGFAGFRVMRPDFQPDWLSFLGASYYRADGPDHQYGQSARGLAIDTGLAKPEEFPIFTAFWLGDPERPGEDLVIYARLSSPSVTGAYRFGATRAAPFGQNLTVEARLFFRDAVQRVGIAPLTSMYWYSETNRSLSPDWRPEVHDTDGLAMATGAGERIWRPLRNPYRVTTSSFFDKNPRGFGLIQRDRLFRDYEDDGVFYNRRPSTWVVPRGDWGAGAVQLVEIPTNDETMDNIVAYWTPKKQPAAGDALSFDYDLQWRARDPFPDGLARVVNTFSGWGGVPGQPRDPELVKYVIDFSGPKLDQLKSGVDLVLEAKDGKLLRQAVRPIVGARGWRVSFDLKGSHKHPVQLRAYLRDGKDALSETWSFLADPGPIGTGHIN